MKAYIKIISNSWARSTTGWGNGYVVLPKDHPFWGVYYDYIPVAIHGGLTYSEPEPNGHDGWCIGFDTCHSGDNEKNWPMEAVQAEAERLLQQMNELGEKYTKEQVKALVTEADR